LQERFFMVHPGDSLSQRLDPSRFAADSFQTLKTNYAS
jgi:hypothetical protein